MQQKHAEQKDKDQSEESESPPSPEFGKDESLRVVVTPPDHESAESVTLPTPDFGESQSKATKSHLVGASEKTQKTLGSPTFGFASSPDVSGDLAEWQDTLKLPGREAAEEPHPSTPDFGSLQRPFLEGFGSSASSPNVSHENSPENKQRLSVDMLLPSPASPSLGLERTNVTNVTERSEQGKPGTKFDFNASPQIQPAEALDPDSPKDDETESPDGKQNPETDELLQECILQQKELDKREKILNWFYEELESRTEEPLG